jgi:hypothetical protein
MRKSLVRLFFLINIGMILCFCPQIQAKTTHLNLNFDLNDLRFEKMNDFDQVFLEDLSSFGKPGEPMLPTKVIRLIIPVDQRIESVKILKKKSQILPETYKIFPVQPQLPVSQIQWNDKKVEFFPPDPQVYDLISEFPGKWVEVISSGFLAGHHIVALAIYPLQYVPKEGKLSFLNQIELELIYQPQERRPVSVSYRSEKASEIYSGMVKSLVINPEEVGSIPQRITSSTQETDVEYLIITPAAFAASFQLLADWKTQKGVPAEVYTLEWITSNYTGVDTQEQIRNFIRDMYQNYGTIWVLLGGDVDYLPHRLAWAFHYSGGWKDDIPADLYYSDLDGNWNADGDGVYGETSDNVDMYPDVFVGRAPVDDLDGISNFINKSLIYEVTPPTDYILKILLTGEVLWTDPYTPGGSLKNTIHYLYIPDRFDSTITKLYESLENLDYNSFRDALNSGQNIVNHYGHGSTSGFGIGSSWWNTGHMDALYNSPRFSMLYTISCLSNAFDFDDCLGEHFINDTDGGGMAYIGNSRYGWGQPGSPSSGSGPRLDMRFFRELFEFDSYHVGKTLSDAKAFYASDAQTSPYYRWTLYALNLLGDPELPIWTDTPGELQVNHPKKILTGAQNFEITVENAGTPVNQAFICLSKNPEIYLRETTSEQGRAIFNFTASDTGVICLVVTAKNYLPYQGIIQACNYFPGDVNADAIVTISDVVFLINYLFDNGPEPDPLETGDANCDSEVTVEDVVFLINYLFKGGPEPCS